MCGRREVQIQELTNSVCRFVVDTPPCPVFRPDLTFAGDWALETFIDQFRCVCLSICLRLHFALCLYSCLSLSLCLCLSLFLPLFVFVCLYICVSLFLCLSLSLFLPLFVSVCLFVYLYISVPLSQPFSLSASVCPSVSVVLFLPLSLSDCLCPTVSVCLYLSLCLSVCFLFKLMQVFAV